MPIITFLQVKLHHDGEEEVWLGDEGIMEEFILDETCTSECDEPPSRRRE